MSAICAVTVTDAGEKTLDAVARPPASMLSNAGLLEDHVTLEVISAVESSEYVPVAVNC
jgi:hypothetical protein